MTITWAQFAWAVGIFILWSGFLVGVIRQMGLSAYVKLEERVERNEKDFKNHLVNLPLDYQRRDDSIREFTVINAKLDKMFEFVARGSK